MTYIASGKSYLDRNKKLKATFKNVKVVSGNVPPYEGSYTVTPTVASQTLLTQNKRMLSNVTINAIPYQEEANAGGGITAKIAFTQGE